MYVCMYVMYVCMYVCMVITYIIAEYRLTGKVANPGDQLNGEKQYFPVPVRA